MNLGLFDQGHVIRKLAEMSEIEKKKTFLKAFFNRLYMLEVSYFQTPQDPKEADKWWENFVLSVNEAGEEFGWKESPFVTAMLTTVVMDVESRNGGKITADGLRERYEFIARLWEGASSCTSENKPGGEGRA